MPSPWWLFAYFLNSHHGDGIVSVCVKVLAGDNQRLIDSDPRRFYMPSYIGPRGWVALRLDVGKIAWTEVRDLVAGSHQIVSGHSATSRVKAKRTAAASATRLSSPRFPR
jgi:phosphoribosylglycinamide formyltransferase-1